MSYYGIKRDGSKPKPHPMRTPDVMRQAIARRYYCDLVPQMQIAREFGVAQSAVSRIVNRERIAG